MSEKTVLLVGHCGPDAFMLKSAMRSHVPGAKVKMVTDDATLSKLIGDASLVLVNRVLDGRFPSDDGIGLIEILAPIAPGKVMLISNFADAQARAEAVGAVPGFGKTDMRSDTTRERIASVIE